MNRGIQLLSAALRERGMSQRACAAATGEDQATIARILSDQRLPSRRAALAFLREFKVPIESWDEPALAETRRSARPRSRHPRVTDLRGG